MKETVTRCDICGDPIQMGNRMARHFLVDGIPVDCCGIQCFLDFWSGHYDGWDRLEVSFKSDPGAEAPQLALVRKQSH